MKVINVPSQGFTLIELMIGMLISLVIAAGAIQLFQYALSATNRANEVQRSQQTLLATIEHILPRIRQARMVTDENPSDPDEHGLLLARYASDINPGHDCTGATVSAGVEVKEFYYSNGEDLYCDSDGNTAVVAFNITGFRLNISYQDNNNDGRFDAGDGDTEHTSAFPDNNQIVGVELEIEQPLVDGGTRTVPLHVALRNNALAGRNKKGDFGP